MSAEVAAFRLSPQQRRLWSMLPGGGSFRAQCSIRLAGPLDRRCRLAAAVQTTVDAHESLRTSFRLLPGFKVPLQVVAEDWPVAWREVDLTAVTPPARAEVLTLLEDHERRLALELGDDPAARFLVVEEAADEHLLICTLSPLSADTKALYQLFDAVSGAYLDRRGGRPHGGAAAVQYVRYAEWQNELSEEAPGAAAGVGGVAASRSPLPGERPVAGDAPPSFARVRARLEPASSAALRAVARQAGVRPAAVLLASWMMVIARQAEREEIEVHGMLDGRGLSELRGVIGLLAKAVPLRARLAPGMIWRELVAAVDGELRSAEEWQESYFWPAEPAEREGRIGFEWSSLPGARSDAEQGFSLARQEVCLEPFKLRLACLEMGMEWVLEVHYDARRLTAAAAAVLLAQVAAAVAGGCRAPEQAIGELALAGAAERHRTLIELNGGRREAAGPALIHRLFERAAERHAESPAVRFEDEVLAYGELNRRANRLAHHLRSRGAGPEVLVGICLERSLETIVALLAVLKAGGAYLPLDPALPAGRLASLLAESGARLVVARPETRGALPGGVEVVDLASAEAEIARRPAGDPEGGATAANLAYVLFTSGSTGAPKGVAVEHRKLVATFAASPRGSDLPAGARYAHGLHVRGRPRQHGALPVALRRRLPARDRGGVVTRSGGALRVLDGQRDRLPEDRPLASRGAARCVAAGGDPAAARSSCWAGRRRAGSWSSASRTLARTARSSITTARPRRRWGC